MFGHYLALDSAGYLAGLLLLPLLWWLGLPSLTRLGRYRRWVVLGLRSLVLILLVLALADAQYERQSDRMTVIYVLDQSLSIPAQQRQAMIEYVNASVAQHHDADRRDRYAVIVFAREAVVEMPLVDAAIPVHPPVETMLDREYTDLATAIQRAQAMFPPDTAKRIVLVTDGNQNLGDAQRAARGATTAGISLDVVPVVLTPRGEIAVEKIDVPANARRGQPFEMRVVLRADPKTTSEVSSGQESLQRQTAMERAVKADPKTTSEVSSGRESLQRQTAVERAVKDARGGQPVAGKLRIVRKAGDREVTVVTQAVTVSPGKQVFTITEQIDQADFYTYEARFTPDDPRADGRAQNNRATGFTQVRGKGQVLFIENWDQRGEFDYLIQRLRHAGLAVTVMPSNRLFASLAELQRYDSVILANVSRSTGTAADNVSSFSDAQIRMLTRNTRELGCGLLMLGGPETFGAGSWTNTELEQALPVDFEIKQAQVAPVGALVLMMHAGEMPRANYWQKRIAAEAIQALGGRDYCGLIEWSGTDQWLWGRSQGGLLRVGKNRQAMLGKIDRMTIGDMPAFDPALSKSATAFAGLTDAAVKHMIVISDGDPTPPTAATIQQLIQQGVRVTTVAVGSHGVLGSSAMRKLARQTQGKYYEVKNAQALPKIYQSEVRKVARPLIYEPRPPVRPLLVGSHEIVRGLTGSLPPITGFVLTSVKKNPLVEVILRSPRPQTERNATILAAWTYGVGKAAVLTTDAGQRWAADWTAWENYDKLFSQLVRWSMRPTDNGGNYAVATHVRDGRAQVIINALDETDQFLDNLAVTGSVVTPEMGSLPLRIEQVAPGRYVGEFATEMAGSYLVVVNPGSGQAPIRTGVNVGYSAEYQDHQTNLALLKSLAKMPVPQGPEGVLMATGLAATQPAARDAANPFRRDLPPAVSQQPIWPWLVLVGNCLFFADVLVRRLHWDGRLPFWERVRSTLFRRQPPTAVPETMSRLRSRKQQLGAQLETRRAAARDETAIETTAETAQAGGQSSAAPPPADEAPPTETSYTQRLLKAKRQVWDDRNQGKPK